MALSSLELAPFQLLSVCFQYMRMLSPSNNAILGPRFVLVIFNIRCCFSAVLPAMRLL